MIPTEHRIPWRADNPLRPHGPHRRGAGRSPVAGWTRAGGDNPWCDTARVARELGLAEGTARRWMRDQVVPSVTDADEFGNARRRCRLADVEAVRDRLAGRILLRDLASELGVGYYRAWRALRRLGLVEMSDGAPSRELVLTVKLGRGGASRVRSDRRPPGQVDAPERRRRPAGSLLQYRAAARGQGKLEEDAETDAFGAHYVTLASVEALAAARCGGRSVVFGAEVVAAATVARLTGLTPCQIADLTVRGELERCDVGRRFHVTAASVRRWATQYGPELLAGLEAAGMVAQRRGSRSSPAGRGAAAKPPIPTRPCWQPRLTRSDEPVRLVGSDEVRWRVVRREGRDRERRSGRLGRSVQPDDTDRSECPPSANRRLWACRRCRGRQHQRSNATAQEATARNGARG